MLIRPFFQKREQELQALVDAFEVEQLALRLAQLCRKASVQVVPPERPKLTSYAALKTIVRLRQLRDKHLGDDLFADPAWSMLLDLAIAGIEKRKTSITSLCIASGVPAGTALRWIRVMTENGILVRSNDPLDGRRIFVELAPTTAEAMEAYAFDAARLLNGG